MVHKFHRGGSSGRENGVMGSLGARRVAKGDRTGFWQAVIVDLFFSGSAWWVRPARRRRSKLALTLAEREVISRGRQLPN
jgi:hypothetical protein